MKLIERVQRYIQKVKSQTEEEKKRAVIIWTVTATILIFIFWVITFSLSVANQQTEDAQLREIAVAKARTLALAETTTEQTKKGSDTSSSSFGEIIFNIVDSVEEGFWVVGGWLHK